MLARRLVSLLGGADRVRLLLPFAAMSVLALVLEGFGTQTNTDEMLAAVALTVVLIAAGFCVPWSNLPSWTRPFVPLTYFVVIVLLRDSHGGASSGYGPLCVMPVFWLAIFGTRRQLLAALGGVALVFLGPLLLVGSPRYPASQWRATVLYTAVLSIVGYRVQALVAELNHRSALMEQHAQDAEQHALELTETQSALQSVAELAREIRRSSDARALICETARTGTGASHVTLVEPNLDGEFHVSASCGLGVELDELREAVRPHASLRAFYSRETVFVPEARDDPGISPLILEHSALRSIAFQPILRGDRPLGVLCVGWTDPKPVLDERTATVLLFLAAEAAAAMERADLTAQLETLANTDALTGLPNRRQWDEQLAALIADGGQIGFCIALLDLDHFKAYNDRYGHPAGDRLLRDAAAAWRNELRGSDLLARYGGEEFALLLPSTSLAEAERVIERIRLRTPDVTSSAGLVRHRPGEEPAALLQRVDDALYQAKRAGRDRLVIAA